MVQAYSVSQINQYIKNLFVRDQILSHIYIKGEVSNCKYHSSGHIYFTLKDAEGQLSCVMFAGARRGLTFRLEEGQSVIVFGNISVYERDGKYQLYANEIVLDGLGKLYERYERLKKDLEAEGLFEQSHKKKIPLYPKRIGIVTASTGAAIQDIINISKRRNPYVQLILYPTQVQGLGSAESIAKGIGILDKLGVDTIIAGRGGGSIEDLWGFNEEIVARAIYKCNTPVISAVGHETDVTIADFVADLRAPTPSAAAELAVNDYMTFVYTIEEYGIKLKKDLMQKIANSRARTKEFKIRLYYGSPAYQIKQKRQFLIDCEEKLRQRIDQRIKDNKHRLELYVTKLETLSPLSKLKQGYAMVIGEDDNPITGIKDVSKNERLTISFLDGEVITKVEDIRENKRQG
mgnify:CR=1 FL=1